jgi:hypothetical protein
MKMLNKIIGGSIAIAAALAFTASTTQAQNLLNNGGFENTGINQNPSGANLGTSPDFSSPAGSGSFTTNPITLTSGPGGAAPSGINQGWATFGGSQNTMATATSSPLGGTYALLAVNNPGNNWNPQGGYQIVTGITAGQIYTYSAFFLKDKSNGTNNGSYATPINTQVVFGHATGTSPFVALEAAYSWGFGPAGSPLQGSVTNLNEWEQASITTVAAPVGATEAEVYLFFMDNGQKVQDQIFFDNASLQATPEPASMALFGIGMASLYFIRRRKS